MSKSGYFGIGMWQTQRHIMNFQVGMFFLSNTTSCGKNLHVICTIPNYHQHFYRWYVETIPK